MNLRASGTLIVEIASDNSGLGITIGGPTGFPQPIERRLLIQVKEGSEVVVDISAGWDIPAAARFTLSTALAP